MEQIELESRKYRKSPREALIRPSTWRLISEFGFDNPNSDGRSFVMRVVYLDYENVQNVVDPLQSKYTFIQFRQSNLFSRKYYLQSNSYFFLSFRWGKHCSFVIVIFFSALCVNNNFFHINSMKQMSLFWLCQYLAQYRDDRRAERSGVRGSTDSER